MSQSPSDLADQPRQPESETIRAQRRRQAIEQRLRDEVDGARDATVRQREPGVFEAEVQTETGESVRRTFRFGEARKQHRKEKIAERTEGVESDEIRFEDGEAVLTREALEEQRQRAVEAATERAVRQALEDAPEGVTRDDLQIKQVNGEIIVTAPGKVVQQREQPTRRPSERGQATRQESEEELRERLQQRVQEQTPFTAIPGTDFEITQAAGGGLAASLTQSGRRKAARKQLERRLESQFGIDVTPGEEFEVAEAEDGGFVPELTLTGQRRIGAARRRDDASLVTEPSQVDQGAEFVSVSPRERGAERRREDPDALSPPSQVEQGAEFKTVIPRERGAARRRDDSDLLAPPSQAEQGAEFETISRREIEAARRRENPDLLTPGSTLEQAQSTGAASELESQLEEKAGRDLVLGQDFIIRQTDKAFRAETTPPGTASGAEQREVRALQPIANALDISVERAQELSDRGELQDRIDAAGLREQSNGITLRDQNVRDGTVLQGLARGFDDTITQPFSNVTAKSGRTTFEPLAEAGARGGDFTTDVGRSLFGPAGAVGGAILAQSDPETARQAGGEFGERAGQGVGRGAGDVLNIPRNLIETARLVAFIEEGARATARGEGGKIVEGELTEPGSLNYTVGGFAEERVDPAVQRAFQAVEDRPITTTAALGGSLALSGSLIGGASRLSPRLGRATSVAIQPGEEAAISAAKVARGTRLEPVVTRGARVVPGVRKGMIGGGETETSTSLRTPAVSERVGAAREAIASRTPSVEVTRDPEAGVIEVDSDLTTAAKEATLGRAQDLTDVGRSSITPKIRQRIIGGDDVAIGTDPQGRAVIEDEAGVPVVAEEVLESDTGWFSDTTVHRARTATADELVNLDFEDLVERARREATALRFGASERLSRSRGRIGDLGFRTKQSAERVGRGLADLTLEDVGQRVQQPFARGRERAASKLETGRQRLTAAELKAEDRLRALTVGDDVVIGADPQGRAVIEDEAGVPVVAEEVLESDTGFFSDVTKQRARTATADELVNLDFEDLVEQPLALGRERVASGVETARQGVTLATLRGEDLAFRAKQRAGRARRELDEVTIEDIGQRIQQPLVLGRERAASKLETGRQRLTAAELKAEDRLRALTVGDDVVIGADPQGRAVIEDEAGVPVVAEEVLESDTGWFSDTTVHRARTATADELVNLDFEDLVERARREATALRFGASERLSRSRERVGNLRDLTIRVGDPERNTIFDTDVDQPAVRSQIDDPLDIGDGDGIFDDLETETEADATDSDTDADVEAEGEIASGEGTLGLVRSPSAETESGVSPLPKAERRDRFTGPLAFEPAVSLDSVDPTDTTTTGELLAGFGGDGATTETPGPQLEIDALELDPGAESDISADQTLEPRLGVVGREGLETGTETRVDTRSDVRLDTRLETGLESRTEPRTESRTETGAEQRVEPRLELRLETPLETRLEARAEPRREFRGELGVEPRGELRAEADSDSARDRERRRGGLQNIGGGPEPPSESFLAPGFLSETIRDAATLGGPARDVEQETLEAQATGVELLTGEVPTGTDLFGTPEEQEAIEATESLFDLGGVDESDDQGALSLL